MSAVVTELLILSLSARRAWIEIILLNPNRLTPPVALRKESVDRNSGLMSAVRFATVALRKESVDRNTVINSQPGPLCYVALRKESVDRNGENSPPKTPPRASLSARRA